MIMITKLDTMLMVPAAKNQDSLWNQALPGSSPEEENMVNPIYIYYANHLFFNIYYVNHLFSISILC